MRLLSKILSFIQNIFSLKIKNIVILKKVFVLFILISITSFLNPQTAQDLYQKGKLAHFNDNYESAIYYLKESLNKNPNYIDALLELSHLYFDLGNYEYAYKYIKTANKLSKNDKLIIFTADIETELKLFDSAEKKYKSILKKNQLNLDAINGLANLYLNDNKYILAKNNLDNALKIDPMNFKAILLTAKYYELTDISKAEEYYRLNINRNSLNPDSFFYFSIFNFKNNRINEAIENIKTAIQLKDQVKYKKYYGKYLLYINQGDNALKIFKDVLQKEKNNYLTYYNIAHAYYLISDIQNALKSLKMAINLRDDDEASIYFMDQILVDDIEVDTDIRKDKAKYFYLKSVKSKKESQYNLFLFFLKEAIRLNPKYSEARIDLADYFLLTKLPERYIRELTVAYRYSQDPKTLERINIEKKRIAYRLGDDWNISQYSVSRDLYKIPVFFENNVNNPHFNIEKIFLNIFKNIFIQDLKFEIINYNDKQYSTAEKLRISKNNNSPFYINTYIKESSAAINISMLLKNSINNETINKYNIIKGGNDRLVKSAYNLQKKINEDIIFKAHILKILKDRAIINAGRQSGIKLKDKFIILKKKDYSIDFNRPTLLYNKDDIKGAGIVLKVDENISEIKLFDDDFFQDIDIDDIVIYKK